MLRKTTENLLWRFPTPEQILGPYYPLNPDPTADSNVAGALEYTLGTKLLVSGYVLEPDGAPVVGALIEAWQCDASGIYPHPHCEGHQTVDPEFRGYGRSTTHQDGSYFFYALRPVSYPGRAPHIHYKISTNGQTRLVTQMYLAGEPENRTDFALWRAGGARERNALIATVRDSNSDEADLYTEFDFVLSPAGAGP